jgi:hypothetical protein
MKLVDGGSLPSGHLSEFGKLMRGEGTPPPLTRFSEEGNGVVLTFFHKPRTSKKYGQ